MNVDEQIERLIGLGLHDRAGTTEDRFRELAGSMIDTDDALVVIHPSVVPASNFADLLVREGKPGFVVEDMTDIDEFAPIDSLDIPDAPLYLVRNVRRGDEMRNWSPVEALESMTASGRTPLTVNEGISWLLQQPELLEPNHCFMCIGSRKPKNKGLDSRTPALWISGGTGRDGRERRGAPKLGWCWANNRHSWLGFASAAERI